ncbi:MAG: hypothetical protein IJI35_16790, partial [Kiritimatiellae bacterium]|nr:hypothetical protein [Kiritimatiellia bacterium]MBQ6330679.1 hypothetical protein [Kiritimatiellia bacterium]
MKIVRGKDEKCVVGIWNDEDDGVLRVNFVGEPASVFTSECIKSSKIEWLVQDLKNHMGEIRTD